MEESGWRRGKSKNVPVPSKRHEEPALRSLVMTSLSRPPGKTPSG